MSGRVVIRTDAAPEIGSGHVMRCLTLANALRARGAEVAFVSRKRAGDMHPVILQAGFDVLPLRAQAGASDAWLGASYKHEIDGAAQLLEALGKIDLLIVDHYSLDARWESRMRSFCDTLVAIDDMCDRAHDCDILLNQNLGAEDPHRYGGLLPSHARLLLGPRYALLREEFRPFVTSERARDGRVERILVFLSGFDPGDHTSKVLRAIAALPSPPRVDVVLPEEAVHVAAVRGLCERSGFRFLGRVESMACSMSEADLAIGAMGTATWERCALGLPALVMTLAENQRGAAHACASFGAVEWIGDADTVDESAIRRHVQELQSDSARVRSMSKCAREVAGAQDGTFSTDRVAGALTETSNV